MISDGECPQSWWCVFHDCDMFDGVRELWRVIHISHRDGEGTRCGAGAVS